MKNWKLHFGQSGVGYGIVQYVSNKYLDECHQIATTFLEENIKYEK